jgi:hypothetical protein
LRHAVTAGFFTIALLCLAAAAAGIWRAARESEPDDARAAVTADFVGKCQSQTPDCVAMVRDAMAWEVAHHRVTAVCLAKRPSERTMARGAIIWLNAHPETHPLPAEQGIARAADAIWPCKAV